MNAGDYSHKGRISVYRPLLLISLYFFLILKTQAQRNPWDDIFIRGFDRTAIQAKCWVMVFTEASENRAFSVLPYKGFGNRYPNKIKGLSDIAFYLKTAMDIENIFFEGKVNLKENPNLSLFYFIEWDSPFSVIRTLPELADECLQESQPLCITIPIPFEMAENLPLPPPLITDQQFLQISQASERRDTMKEITLLTNYYASCANNDLDNTNDPVWSDKPELTEDEIKRVWNKIILPMWEEFNVEIDINKEKGIVIFNFERSIAFELWMSFTRQDYARPTLAMPNSPVRLKSPVSLPDD
jgi:hypothetical protein